MTTRTGEQPLLAVENLVKTFPGRGSDRTPVRAVDNVSLRVEHGQTLAIVGESGSGKSTTGRAIMQLIKPDSGSVRFRGTELVGMRKTDLRRARRGIQMVFQDPQSCLNPRRRVGAILEEALGIHEPGTRGSARRARTEETLALVGLGDSHYRRFPHELSGGQRQRVGIARALMADPELIVCDEAVSALDVSVQSQILNLLRDLQRDRGLSYLFISHDMGVVRYMADQVAVMRHGQVIETGDRDQVFNAPAADYTRQLLDAVPTVQDALDGHNRVSPGRTG